MTQYNQAQINEMIELNNRRKNSGAEYLTDAELANIIAQGY